MDGERYAVGLVSSAILRPVCFRHQDGLCDVEVLLDRDDLVDRRRTYHTALYRLYLGVADGLYTARVWTCRRLYVRLYGLGTRMAFVSSRSCWIATILSAAAGSWYLRVCTC